MLKRGITMIKCQYCETENLDGEVFCKECGRLLKKSEKKKNCLLYTSPSPRDRG